MKGYIRKYDDSNRKRPRRRRRTPTEKRRPDFAALAIKSLMIESEMKRQRDMGQMAVDALNAAVLRETAVREQKKERQEGEGTGSLSNASEWKK